MTQTEYDRRANAIELWARAQYALGDLSEAQIEHQAERMMDALDAEFMRSE